VLTVTTFVVASALSLTADAQDASPADVLSEIREHALYARYPAALEGVNAFLERDDLDAANRNSGLEVLATIQIAMRRERPAAQILSQLYARDPQHRLTDPDASPTVQSAFARARSNPPEPVQVQVEHATPELSRRAPPTLDVTLGGEGADAVQELRLRYRQGGRSSFTTVVLEVVDGAASTRLPLADTAEAYEVEYALEALAPSGTALANLGSTGDPLTLAVPEAPAGSGGGDDYVFEGSSGGGAVDDDEGGSLTWLWITLVAVAVVAGGVTAALLVASDSGGATDGSLGNIELSLVSF